MPARKFEATVRNQTNTAIIDLHGEINAQADQALNAAYAEVEGHNPLSILLNFSDVDYMNSTGIALIVGLLAQARKSHRRLIVYGLSDHYRELFTITRLSDFMSVFLDEVSALADSTESAANPQQ
jgi:anti-anti-sigma factor